MGLTKIQKAKNLLNKYAPKGEELAYINSKEAKLLKSMGGAGIDINGTGIKSYVDFGFGPGSVSESLGGSSSSSSSSSSSDNGNDDNRENYISQQYTAPAPEPEPEYTVQDDLTDFATNVMKTANPEGGFEDDVDDGEELYKSPTLTMKEQEPYINYKPGPNTVTAEELLNLERGLGDADEQAATLAKIQAVNPIQKAGFFDSGIGKVLKTTAGLAAATIAPAFLPAAVAKPYTAYNQLRTFANIPSKFGLTDKRLPSFTQIVKNMPKGTTIKKPPTGYESGSDERPIPKDVVTASVQKFSPKEINNLQSNIALLESVLDSGQYRGTKLNSLQLSQVSNQRNSLLEQYNMIQEYLV